MEWKLTELAEQTKVALEQGADNFPGSFGGGDGFWYDITLGGYFSPEKALADKEQVKAVKEALALLKDLERKVYDKLVPEM